MAHLIRIAFIGPLTGVVAPKGIGGRNSADLAVKLQNQKDATRHRYELVVLDDECRPEIGVAMAERAALDPTIVAGVTHYCSVVAMAAIGVYHTHGLPVVVWGAHQPEITDANDFPEIHRVNGTFRHESVAAATLMTHRGHRRWVILHDTTPYGNEHHRFFAEALRSAGGEVGGVFALAPDQNDVDAEMAQTKVLAPDAIYLAATPAGWWKANASVGAVRPTQRPGWMPLAVLVRRAMERVGIVAQLHCTAGILYDTSFIDGAGALAEGTLAFKEGGELPGGAVFAANYRSHSYQEPAESYGPFAFAAAALLLDIIERVGPDRIAVRNALNSTLMHDSILGPIRFDEHGQNLEVPITGYVVREGRWRSWTGLSFA